MDTLVLLVAITGCTRESIRPRHMIVLVDVSASIDPASLGVTFSVLDEIAKQLRRGDPISVIPITGDAEAKTQGNIIRLKVATTRTAYDQDLPQFSKSLHTAL